MTAVPLAGAPSATTRPGVGARVLMLPIRAWRLLSVHLPPRCRFYPSCSQYALDALTIHGALRGSGLAVRRVARCHPWHDGGLDPVPPPRDHHDDHDLSNTRSQPDLQTATATIRPPGRAEET
jgi:hypothetical protein